ncbi:MAG: hypothetical protein ACRETR_04290 [Steroidobacteraceae bacterium]
MTDELEKALRRALRPQGSGKDLSGEILSRLEPGASPAAPAARRGFGRQLVARSRWLPLALAACLVAGIGLVQMRQHARDVARANEARAQLLQALSIASDNVNVVRAAVAREEHPDT